MNDNPYQSPGDGDGQPPPNPLKIPAICLLVLVTINLLLLAPSSLQASLDSVRILSDAKNFAENLPIAIALMSSHIGMGLSQIAILFGSINMLRLSSRRMSMLAAVLSVIPLCSSCLVVGMPFGIWALVLLKRDEVSQRFRKR